VHWSRWLLPSLRRPDSLGNCTWQQQLEYEMCGCVNSIQAGANDGMVSQYGGEFPSQQQQYWWSAVGDDGKSNVAMGVIRNDSSLYDAAGVGSHDVSAVTRRVNGNSSSTLMAMSASVKSVATTLSTDGNVSDSSAFALQSSGGDLLLYDARSLPRPHTSLTAKKQ
jgi:hypothetical protein